MSSVNDRETESTKSLPDFPLYVRILAVAHVLSLILGPLGCVMLVGIAWFMWVRHGFDGWVVGLSLAGIGWLLFWIGFRRWFVWWGRKNWPETVKGDEQNPSG
jgi:hypothetical protein